MRTRACGYRVFWSFRLGGCSTTMVPACSNDAQGEQALDTITHPGAPCVVKDDSLAFGKGVIVT